MFFTIYQLPRFLLIVQNFRQKNLPENLAQGYVNQNFETNNFMQ